MSKKSKCLQHEDIELMLESWVSSEDEITDEEDDIVGVNNRSFVPTGIDCILDNLQVIQQVENEASVSELSVHNITNEDQGTSHPSYLELLNKERNWSTKREFQNNASNSGAQSIDESMIKFKGRDSKKQYMPLKPIKRGYKAWCRCDAATGYLYECDIYTGKERESNDEGLGYRVVMKLSQQVPRNTLLIFDNFFTSLPLMEQLQSRGIYSLGTVRMQRKGLPEEFREKKNLSLSERKAKRENNLSTGEFTFRYSEPVGFIKWRDTKDVHLLTTAIDPRNVETIMRRRKDGKKKPMFCPSAIAKYTENMGGVDHFDHFRSSYSIGRKSKKSWFRLFWFLFECTIINSYILYKQGVENRENTHMDFRLRLARGLKANFQCPKKQSIVTFKNKKGGVFGVPDEIRLGQRGEHWPIETTFKRCRYCSTREQEKRSKYECKICRVPLCVAPCMEKYHT